MTIPTPNGFAGNMFFEPLVRQFLAYQMRQITANVNDPGVTFIDELFGRMGDVVRLQVKKWLATHPHFAIEINFPREESTLPFVAIVSAEENELSRETYLGDDGGSILLGGRSVEASTPTIVTAYGEQPALEMRPKATHVRQLLSVPESRVARLYIATDDVNTTLYLYMIIKALILVNKLDFDQHAGVRNLKMSGSDFDHKQELFPTFAYFKVLTLSYDANFDVPLSPVRTIGGVDVSLTTFLGT